MQEGQTFDYVTGYMILAMLKANEIRQVVADLQKFLETADTVMRNTQKFKTKCNVLQQNCIVTSQESTYFHNVRMTRKAETDFINSASL